MAQTLIRLFLAIAIIITMGSACGLGTETGNPIGEPSGEADTQEGNGAGAGAAPVADGFGGGCPITPTPFDQDGETVAVEEETQLDELIQRLCLEIFVCDKSIGTLDCNEALNGPDGDQILDEFGIVPEGFLTVEQVHSGLRQGIITTDEINYEECKSAIREIECIDVLENVTKDDFSNVENIIPEDCEEVFDQLPDAVVDLC